MKHFFALTFLLALISCGGGSTTPTPTPAAPLEVAKAAVGTLIGTPVTQAIGSSGGNASVVSASAKIVVPAGAMTDGSSISVQAISNTLAGSGQGIRLSGSDWTQPITVQFSYPASITDPENQMIAVQNPDGSWVSSNRVKVDAVNRTISIRLAPDPSSLLIKGLNASGLKAAASTSSRDIIWTKKFFLKPDTASVKLGESVSFTAYAKEARNRGEAKLSADDLDLLDRVYVLKAQVDKLFYEVDDDFLQPLTIVVKEFPFTNNKAGYNRTWTTSGPGNIVPSGATSGKFTAPTDPSAKGKTATVTFVSTNTKTGDIARASASVNIESDTATYKGTLTVKKFHDITEGNPSFPTIRKYSATITGNMVFELEASTSNSKSSQFVSSSASSTICDDYAISTDIYSGAERHSKVELISADGSDGIADKISVRIYLDKIKNTFEISGGFSSKVTVKQTDDSGFVSTYPTELRIEYGVKDLPFGDGVQLTGSKSYVFTEGTYTVTWNLTRQ
jgi:hypothetical protein